MSDDEARDHEAIAEACLAASPADLPPRLALYRRLVRNNLTGVTEKMLVRTRARVAAFDATFAEFLEARGPRTHYLRDVPREFLVWAEAAWPARTDVPTWALDLARYELAHYEIAAARVAAEPPAAGEIALDRGLVFAEPIRLLRFEYAVHELPDDPDDRTELAARPTSFLVYRDAEHDPCFLELHSLESAITSRLLEGATLGDAVTLACTALGTAPNDALLGEVSQLLANLGERGVVLGGRVAPGPR